ncbi:hypothetical protein BDR03DRAFT_967044 [Suillus americanus]|nr:hypothetical protein BDR03DRAFT_967044 [Suillus americanus]
MRQSSAVWVSYNQERTLEHGDHRFPSYSTGQNFTGQPRVPRHEFPYLSQGVSLPSCLHHGTWKGSWRRNIPSECVSSGKVLLLVLWRDTEPEASCPTPSQVYSLEMKLKCPPGWWVEVPVCMHVHFESRSADVLEIQQF